jgi:hypothetical protein
MTSILKIPLYSFKQNFLKLYFIKQAIYGKNGVFRQFYDNTPVRESTVQYLFMVAFYV